MTKPLQSSLDGEKVESEASLISDFIVPPFSILDTRQGYWQNRKRMWISLGIAGEEGRQDNLLNPTVREGWNGSYQTGSPMWRKIGSSVFDPTLTEIMYFWFSPQGGEILDPFSGGITRGLIAEIMGHKYTGIEIRKEQIDANLFIASKFNLSPTYILGDSRYLDRLIPNNRYFDMIFTCPPYFDLEVYSEDDMSNVESYERFKRNYVEIFKNCFNHLKNNRFCVLVVSEIRNKKSGFYRNFVGDNITIMQNIGFKYYNEIILLNEYGSLPFRARHPFEKYRKVGRSHQNVLIFYKGRNADEISKEFTFSTPINLIDYKERLKNEKNI